MLKIPNKKNDLIVNNIMAFKSFIKDDFFKNAVMEQKIVCIDKMIFNILNSLKNTNILYILIHSNQIKSFKLFVENNISTDILNNCKSYKILKKVNILNCILEQILSIKNEFSQNIKRKVITIFGLRIKLKIINNKQYKKILKYNVRDQSVLLIEANECHNETLPSFAKYFSDLGFNVDILITPEMYLENVFAKLDKKYFHNIFYLNINQMQKFFTSGKLSEYEYAFINSNRLYYKGDRTNPIKFFDFFKHVVSPKNGFIILEHHLEYLNEMNLAEKKILQLANYNNGALFCNANYFGEIVQHNKNKTTNFIVVGEFKDYRRSVQLLFESVMNLLENGVDNFKITIVTREFLHEIPVSIRNFFDLKLNLPFDKLYNELEKADFFIPCLDPENTEHKRYIKDGTSGSFQLIYGFNIPCLIESTFAKVHYFTNKNSVIYHRNTSLADTMARCISMNNSEYQNIKNNLKKTVQKINDISAQNLNESISYKQYKIVSLGNDCLPRTYTTEFGIKNRKYQSECSMPFDLCFTPTNALYDILKNNFSDYFKNIFYDKSSGYWQNSKYKILYNHDKDCRNNNKGKKELCTRLRTRILNFNTTINYSGTVYFIINNPINEQLTNSIYYEIKNKRKNKPFKFIVLDIAQRLKYNNLEKDIIIFNQKHPFLSEGDWWKDENKTLNQEYQKKVMSFVNCIIENNSKPPVHAKQLV